MNAPTIRDIDYLLVVNRVRWRGAKANGGVVNDAATYMRTIDQLLDQRLTLMGLGATCGCNATKNLYGTTVALCPRCDFRTCQACGHQVHSLTVIVCPTCGKVPVA